MAAYMGTEESTSFWSKADIVVEELAELHDHMGETLCAQLCITSRPMQRIRHIPRVNPDLNQILGLPCNIVKYGASADIRTWRGMCRSGLSGLP